VPSVSAVVPVYNSEQTLPTLVERVRATLSALASEWELILVNDGSSDRSWVRIEELAAEDPRVRGVDLTRNFGQHNALLAGLASSRNDVVVTLDDDLQHPPEEIPKLLANLTPGTDVVYGIPVEKQHPLHRRAAAATYRRTLSLLRRSRTPLLSSGSRAIRRDVVGGLGSNHGLHVSLDGLLRRATDRVRSVRVKHEPRRAGDSNYDLPALVRHAIAELSRNVGRRERDTEASYTVRRTTGTPLVALRDGPL